MNARFDIIVIGSGFAGLSAAAALAGSGAKVLVLEARPQLGGRATAFVDRETGELVDNGQHVLFGCYRDTLAFLDRVGARGHVRMQPALELVCYDRMRQRSVLRCPRLPAPLHLLAGILKWGPIPWRERLAALGMAGPIAAARRQLQLGGPLQSGGAWPRGRVSVEPAGATVQTWLDHVGQGPTLQEWLWHPLTVAALNQLPEHAAADAFVRILAEMFAPDATAAAVVLPTRPLHQMYAEPAQRYIEARGGEVRLSALARVVSSPGGSGSVVDHVAVRGERFAAAAVIAAVPWFALSNLFAPAPPAALAGTIAAARQMTPMPIVTVNLWYDRPVMAEAFVGLPGRQMQWVFDKRVAFGGDASHLSLVSSGASEIVGRSRAELVALAASEVEASLPMARGVRPVRGTVVREKQATFSLAPGGPPRPGAVTEVGGLYLAGDWTATGLPATIESAVRSGHDAARMAERGDIIKGLARTGRREHHSQER